jgi:nicotinate phosphoribosyltransferase
MKNENTFKPIINSLLDTDLYKFTMMQAVFCEFPGIETEFNFKCRNGEPFTPEQAEEISKQIDYLCSLKFKEEELKYLGSLRFMKPHFIEYLSLFQLKRKHINISLIENNQLNIRIKGPWLSTILFEVPVLAIVNEVYFKNVETETYHWEVGKKKLDTKIDEVNNFIMMFPEYQFSDFGTRRRFSKDWQEYVVKTLSERLPKNVFTGTSNVYLAMKYCLTPIGTMAHEWLQAGQGLTRISESQKFMFQKWADVYRGDLGIALSDVVGVDAFIKDFDAYFCKLFDGCRHDSGNPIEWGHKIIDMYEKYKIQLKTKRLVFSDGLDFQKSFDIFMEFADKTNVTFGIGTHLTNDVGLKPLNIVIKMVRCNGQPVAKISDSKGKGMCEDDGYITYLKQVFQIKD